MKKIIVTLTLFNCFVFASCKKDKTNEDQLPPPTQTGANTFGCKINGKVFVPKGYDGTGRPNPHVQYDFDLNGQPYLSIDSKRYIQNQVNGAVFILFNNLTSIGIYPIPPSLKYSVGWSDIIPGCGMGNLDTSVSAWGGDILPD
ncbi:MAG: hypothetical protein ABIU55_05295 [Ferruginibacter sp.]